MLADDVVVAQLCPPNVGKVMLHILGDDAYLGATVYFVSLADDGPTVDGAMGSNDGALSNRHMGTDNGKRLNVHVICQFRLGIDNGCGVYGHKEFTSDKGVGCSRD